MQSVSKLTTLASLAAVSMLAASASAQIGIYPSTTAFTDISVTGTSPGSASDDSEHNVTAAVLAAAGFAGNELLAVAPIRIGNNGGVVWNTTTFDVGYINSTTFLTMAPVGLNTVTGNGGGTNQFLAVLWDDNFPTQAANTLDWQVIGGNLIIQWTNEDHFNAQGTGTIQYQMVVYGGVTIASRLPLVEFIYNDTVYTSPAYQDDGGSATIGYKNWGVNALANDVQYGLGGGTDTLADPTFAAGTNMQPKVGGWVSAANASLPKSVAIRGDTPPPTVYCTAGTTTNGCTANINASANPDVAHSNVCVITATDVEGQKSGIIFYGIAPTAGTWCLASNSFLCVKAPTQRTPAGNSGGTADQCDGVLLLDWNNYQLTHAGALGQVWLSGNKAYVQAWFRDPMTCNTTNMSDAVSITYVP